MSDVTTAASPEIIEVRPKKLFGRVIRVPANTRPIKMERTRDLLRTAMMFVIIMTVSQFQVLIPALAVFRPAMVSIAIVAVLAYLNPRLLADGSLFGTWQGKVTGVLVIVACLSIPAGINMGHAGLFVLEHFWKTIATACLIIATIRTAKDLYTYCWAYLLGCGVLGYISLYVFKVTNFGSYERLGDMHAYDTNDVGLVMCAGIGIGLLLFRTAPNWFARVVSAICLVFIFGTISMSGSRGAFVSVVFVGLAIVMFDRTAKPIPRLLQILLGAALLNHYAPRGYWTEMRNIVMDPEEDYNYSSPIGRRATATRGVGYMLSYPAFGVGIGNFSNAECTIGELAKSYVPGTPQYCMAAHNSYVQAGAELGVPGLITWTALAIGGILVPLYTRKRLPKRWLNGDAEERFLFHAAGLFPVCMVGFAVGAFFLSFTWYDVSFLLFALGAGFNVAIRAKKRQNVEDPPPVAPVKMVKKAKGWRTSFAATVETV